uniref:Uncharacterized protein n=1 Tax=Heliothis virescens TaxID=7102 RepID=A0A2A4J3J7_HELVI
MADATLDDFLRGRCRFEAELERFDNFLNSLTSSYLDSAHMAALQSRISFMLALYDDFDVFQTELEVLSENVDDMYDERERIESRYFALVARAKFTLKHGRASSAALVPALPVEDVRQHGSDCGHDLVQLPEMDLSFVPSETSTGILTSRGVKADSISSFTLWRSGCTQHTITSSSVHTTFNTYKDNEPLHSNISHNLISQTFSSHIFIHLNTYFTLLRIKDISLSLIRWLDYMTHYATHCQAFCALQPEPCFWSWYPCFLRPSASYPDCRAYSDNSCFFFLCIFLFFSPFSC